MRRHATTVAALIGFGAVLIGAFGAHALEDRLSEVGKRVYQTGVQYHFWHALAMFAAGLLAERDRPYASAAAVSFLIGIVLFSGSLYLLALTEVKRWGAVTPFGGLSFLAGWALLALAARPRGRPELPGGGQK